MSLGVEPVFTGTYDEGSLFFECGQEVLDEPAPHAGQRADQPDAHRRRGPRAQPAQRRRRCCRALDAVHLAPGFAFSEREAGTNGLGLALADRVPSVVRAEEHYSACAPTPAPPSPSWTRSPAASRAPSTSPPGRGRRATCCSRSPSRPPATRPRSCWPGPVAAPGRPRAGRCSGSRPNPAPAPCGTCHRPGPTASRGPSGRWPPAGSWPPSASPAPAGRPAGAGPAPRPPPRPDPLGQHPGLPGHRLLAATLVTGGAGQAQHRRRGRRRRVAAGLGRRAPA